MNLLKFFVLLFIAFLVFLFSSCSTIQQLPKSISEEELGFYDLPLEGDVLVYRIQARASTDTFRLKASWTPNTEPDLKGYKFYYGIVSGEYSYIQNVGNVTEYIINGLAKDTRYYCALTAYDYAGNESDFSNEVTAVTGGDQQVLVKIYDINGNGIVSASDTPLLNRYYGQSIYEYDYNDNGIVSVSDKIILRQHYGEMVEQ